MELNSQYQQRWWVLASLAFGILAVGLDMTILNLALPIMAQDMHATNAELQWFVDAYNLVFAALLLPMGMLGDRIGRKRMLLAGLLVFGAASLACAYAASPWELITARVFLGLGASLIVPLSMAVIPVMFAEKERPKAIAVWMMANAVGIPLGPILGGWLLNNYWWGSVFIINLPLVIVAITAVFFLLPETRSEERRPVDLPGVLISSSGLIGLTYGVIEAGERGWDDVIALASVLAGMLLLLWFIVYQARTPHPLVDPSLFRSRSFAGGTWIGSIISFALFGVLFALPQYLQAVLEMDALSAGLRLLPLVIGLLIGTPISDALQSRFGTRTAIVIGSVLLGIGLAMGSATDLSTGYGFTSIWISAVGLGIGLALPAAMDEAVSALTPERSGVGSALLMAMRQVGGTLGVAILGAVLSAGYRNHLNPDEWPAETAEMAQRNLSSGLAAARQIGSDSLVHSAKTSFVGGMAYMLRVCAGAAVVGIVFAFCVLRARPVKSKNATTSLEAKE
ncbi:Antiseptic resistance protein [Paenibacillus sp. CECT 9249]|uniref:MFS transporter n=1 Tax=Paenibacillus sp. CECT 9249 TaxID=2845385 RepID=UPI001E4B16F8|nr:MFS transporter [Paenibacillus sp. CECT 9249]CAH0122265.1 Antiseptic resistance protein [Paenibacillus sp. CECT 9249]